MVDLIAKPSVVEITIPAIEAQARIELKAVFKFVLGLLGSGVVAVAGGAWSQITFRRVAVLGVVLGVAYGAYVLVRSERVATAARGVAEIAVELREINRKLDVANEKLGNIDTRMSRTTKPTRF